MSRLKGGADIEAVALGAQSFHAPPLRNHTSKHTVFTVDVKTKAPTPPLLGCWGEVIRFSSPPRPLEIRS